MKFTINKYIFNKNLNNVTKIISSKLINPVLKNIKLSLTNEGLNLTASNDDTIISQTIPSTINNQEIIRDIVEGSILVDGKILADISKKIEGNEINFELIDNSIARIKNNVSQFDLKTISENEYPNIDFSKEGTEVTFTLEELKDIVSKISFAASAKSTRRNLTAVNFNGDGTNLRITATDGSRLATKLYFKNIENAFDVNIPTKSLDEILKCCEDEKAVKFYISDKKVLAQLTNCVIITQLISEKYPNIKNIIPKDDMFNYYLTINSNEFINAIERVSLLSSDIDKEIKLSMNQKEILLSSQNEFFGSAHEKINSFVFRGEELNIIFNVNHVLEAVKAINSDDITISFIGEIKPFKITSNQDVNLIQLLTPIRGS